MLYEQHRQCRTRLEALAEIVLERRLGRAASRRGIQPKFEQLRGEAAGLALEVDGHELSCGLVACHEQCVEDTQRAPTLQPFDRTDQLALESGTRAELKHEQLRGGQGHYSPRWESASMQTVIARTSASSSPGAMSTPYVSRTLNQRFDTVATARPSRSISYS